MKSSGGRFASFESDYQSKAEQGLVLIESVRAAVRMTAYEIEDYIKKSMQLPKSGLPYSRAGGIHIASAPGEPPAVDSGKLIGSVTTQFSEGGFEAEIGVFGSPYYAGFLEMGTARMAARPYIKPAAEEYAPIFLANIAAAVKVFGEAE